MKPESTIGWSLTLALILASGATAQRSYQQQQTRGAQQQAPSQPQARSQAREAAHVRAMERLHASPEWRSQARLRARDMLQHEHAYRLRVARIERMQEIYRQQGRQERVRELQQLRTRAENLYRERREDCRELLGDPTFDLLRDRIREQDRLRDRDRLEEPDRDRDRTRDRDRLDQPAR